MVQELCGAVARMMSKMSHMAKTCGFTTRIKAVSGFAVLFVVKRNNYLFILFTLVGCNQKLAVPKVVSIDSTLLAYVQDFVNEGAAHGHPFIIDNLIVHYTTSLSSGTLGECLWEANPRILINANVWLHLSVTSRKAVMMHELGHCVLNLDHDTLWISLGGDYIPRSIMYPSIQNDVVYQNHWAYYMQELFNGP